MFIDRFREARVQRDDIAKIRGEVGLENAGRVITALERVRPAYEEAAKMLTAVTGELRIDTTLDFAARNDDKYVEENVFGLKILDKRIKSWEMYTEEHMLWPKGFKAHVYAAAILVVVSDQLITPLDTEPWKDDARVVLGIYGGFGTDLPLNEPGFKFRVVEPCDPMTLRPSLIAEALAGAMAVTEDALAATVNYARWGDGPTPTFADDGGTHPIISAARQASAETFKAVTHYLQNPTP